MRFKKTLMTLSALLTLLMLASIACNLFSPQEAPEVVEEVLEIETPETDQEIVEEAAEPAWSPEMVFQLDHEDTVGSVAYAHDGTRFATGTFMQINIWDAMNADLVSEIETTHTIDDMGFLPGDEQIASGLGVGGVNLFAVSNGEQIHRFHGGYNNFMALSPDGGMIATGNRTGITWIWRLEDGELLAEMDPGDYHEDYSEWLTSLAYTPDGKIIAAGHWDGTVFLWDAEEHTLIYTLSPEYGYSFAWGLDFSTDGRYLAVGSARLDRDEVIAIWNVSEGTLAHNLIEFSRGGSSNTPVAFSPDGTLLAAGAVDGIFLWSMPEFDLLHFIPIEETEASDWVTDLAFSPDSQYLLAGYWDNTAVLWQVQP